MHKAITATGLLAACTILLCLTPVWAGGEEETAAEGEKAPTWSTVPFFNWIMDTQDPLDQFSFFVNGVQTDNKAVKAIKYKDSLHVHFHLAYEAETTVEVRRQGESILQRTLFYAPSYESGIVPDTSTFLPFHTEEREAPCRRCHRLTVKPADQDPPQVEEQICYPCHRHQFGEAKSRHKLVTERWRCLQCHRPEANPSRWSPDQPLKFTIEGEEEIAPLCYRCHKKFEARVKGYPFLHGPLGMGGCTTCHNPHASKFPLLLQNEMTTLCVNCHEMKDMLTKPVVHQVIKTKGCTTCHHPHGSRYPLQLRATVHELCTSCHQAIAKRGNNHPVQGHPVQIKGGGHDKKDKLTCVSCHSPHASEFPKLLAEEEMMLCTRCHAMGSK